MKLQRLGTFALLASGCFGAIELAYSQPTMLKVTATMDVYRAGGYDTGIGGLAPAEFSFTAAPGQVITFRVGGMWACGDAPLFGADGTTSGACIGPTYVTNPIGKFSGIDFTDFACPLVGIFLEDSLPTSAPPPLQFYITDSSQGGIPTNFTTLSPLIGQVFFIGDGLTGTGSGTFQKFIVPPTATSLYLGFIDTNGAGRPSEYSDNIGWMEVEPILHTSS